MFFSAIYFHYKVYGIWSLSEQSKILFCCCCVFTSFWIESWHKASLLIQSITEIYPHIFKYCFWRKKLGKTARRKKREKQINMPTKLCSTEQASCWVEILFLMFHWALPDHPYTEVTVGLCQRHKGLTRASRCTCSQESLGKAYLCCRITISNDCK